MRARLLLFLLLGLVLFGAMSLLVVCEAPQAEQVASLPLRVVGPEPQLPVRADVACAEQLSPVRHDEAVREVTVVYPACNPVEISPLSYEACVYYAFHYADEAG